MSRAACADPQARETRRALRVAHLLPNMNAGGRERIVAQLCAHAPSHGIVPHVIAYDPDDAGDRLYANASYHPVDRRRDFARALDVLIAAERINVVHAHGHVAAALAASVARAVPVVVTLHIALGTGWRWAPAVAKGLRAAAAVTAVSHDLAARYRLLAGRRIAVIPPGVDLPAVQWGDRPPSQTFTIGVAARLHPIKRHRDAIAALDLLDAQEIPCRLAFAGQGPLERSLRRRARGRDVRFDGHIADMPSWLRGLDAFLLPSGHEGTPLALLEACAAGLPCIATRVGGIPAAVGDAALLVPPRRPTAIASAIRRLIEDPELRGALGTAARDRMALSPVSAMAEHYRAVYDRCLIEQAASGLSPPPAAFARWLPGPLRRASGV